VSRARKAQQVKESDEDGGDHQEEQDRAALGVGGENGSWHMTKCEGSLAYVGADACAEPVIDPRSERLNGEDAHGWEMCLQSY
jgi:hypothetical protein